MQMEKNQNFFMGCYGIGVGRVVAAAIEQNNDDKGICLPSAIAPFEVVVIQADKKDDNVFKISEKIYEMLKDKNYDVALDDRVESPGVKFKDAELIGIPYQIVIGPKSLEKNVIEFKNRRTNFKEDVPVDNLNKLLELINEQ